MTVRVVLADDQARVRAGFRLLLETEVGFEVCGEAADGAQAVELARRHRPDVVVMDIRMPGTDGLAATRQITADPQLAGVRVLVLTTFDVDEYVFEALRSGASGFLLKDTEPVDLLHAIRVVAAGEALLAPTVTRRLIAEFANRPEHRRPDPAALRELTEREREVLALVAEGHSNAAIARILSLTEAGVVKHIGNVLSKLDLPVSDDTNRRVLAVLTYLRGRS